ncbi:MAG: sulfotransferase domain-containing protein [Chlamydiales bacterium]|nr:sulfotransferase domain-containing protein [Chlamydiia bacterium]MCP5507793.1 sulfotransferase domain-containing protein [Chlamydiales bacterium]
MKILVRQFVLVILLMTASCAAEEFPDLGGILDFSQPEEISDRLFILTNPKSGSHLLLYSIMKVTKRPLRGRLPLWHFHNDPPCFPPDNIMGYELDFTKPTTYWGHEYYLLSKLNHSRNKLIFILRDYKENLTSNVMIFHQLRQNPDPEAIDSHLHDLIINEEPIFQEWLTRLELFDSWDPDHRLLVHFEDLVHHPENFLPQVLAFIGDDSDYLNFIDNYDAFKQEISDRYDGKKNRTGSGSNVKFFRQYISKETLQKVDAHMEEHYPDLWERYLKEFKEQD